MTLEVLLEIVAVWAKDLQKKGKHDEEFSSNSLLGFAMQLLSAPEAFHFQEPSQTIHAGFSDNLYLASS